MATNQSSQLSLWFAVVLVIAGVVGAMAMARDPARDLYLALSVFAIISGVIDLVLYARRKKSSRPLS